MRDTPVNLSNAMNISYPEWDRYVILFIYLFYFTYLFIYLFIYLFLFCFVFLEVDSPIFELGHANCCEIHIG